MKTTPIALKIENPCTESWETMSATANGKFCAHCQHEVTDFTGMSDGEIIHFLSKTKGKVCGRAHKDQLNRQLFVTTPISKPHWGKWLAGLLLLSTANYATAQNAQQTHMIAPQQPNATDKQVPPVAKPDTELPKNTFSGKVLDAETKEPLYGASVVVKNTLFGMITDLNGNFLLTISDSLLTEEITFSISSIFYEATEFTVKKSELSLLKEILLLENKVVLQGDIIIIQRSKKWWQFWK